MHLALSRRMPKNVCLYLMSKGADPFLQNDHCRTAFYSTLQHPDADIIDIFKPILLDPLQRKKMIDDDPFIDACHCGNHTYNVAILEKLLSYGFNPNISWRKFYPITLLFASSRNQNDIDYKKLFMLKWLLENAGVNPNSINPKGRTLLHLICRKTGDWYVHPLTRNYILQYPKFNWLCKDIKGLIPCEYILDAHLVLDRTYPNFLCQIILLTGLHHITDQSLSRNVKAGDRLKLAKTILFLKYNSLVDRREKQIITDDEILMIKRITEQFYRFYPTNQAMKTRSVNLYQSMIISCVKAEVTTWLSEKNYLELIKQIILTDLIVVKKCIQHN